MVLGVVNWSNVLKYQLTAFANGRYAGKYLMLSNVDGVMPWQRDSRIKRIKELRGELAELETPTMEMQDSDGRQPPHILIRGDYATPGDCVEPGMYTAAISVLDPEDLVFSDIDSPENPTLERSNWNHPIGFVFVGCF